jgi:hypothetical protein
MEAVETQTLREFKYSEIFIQKPPNFPELVESDINNVFLSKTEFFLNRLNLDDSQKQKIKDEWSVARVLALYLPTWSYLREEFKPKINSGKLKELGFDSSRIVRFLILEEAFPKGAVFEANQIRLTLEEKHIGRLLEAIREVIPGYQSFDRQQLINLLETLRIKENKIGGNYVGVFNQQDFQELIRQIIFTHSA